MKKSILLVMTVALMMVCMVGSAVAEGSPTGTTQVDATIAGCSIGIDVPAPITDWSLNRADSNENQKYIGNVAVTSTCGWTLTAEDSKDTNVGHMTTSDTPPAVMTDLIKIFKNGESLFQTLDAPVQIGSGSGNGDVPVYLRQTVKSTDVSTSKYTIIIEFTGSNP